VRCYLGEVQVMFKRFLLVLLLAAPGAAQADSQVTYSDWVSLSDEWKRGYVFGIAAYQASVVGSDEAPALRVMNAYRTCLGNFSDAGLVGVVDNYYAQNPTAATEDLIFVTMKALYEVCKPFLPGSAAGADSSSRGPIAGVRPPAN